MSNQSPASETAVLYKSKMIGRRGHLNKVKKAITGDQKKSFIFFFEGDGGIGKTRLQEEIGDYVKTLQETENKRIRWSGIVDLYHSDMHSNSRIEQALIEQLDPGQEFFQEYEDARRRFEAQRLAGLEGTSLEAERLALTQAFTRGFKQLTRVYRVVLAIDTLELMQHESSTVRDICQVEEETSVVKNWLLEQTGQFSNTVTVFTGRPRVMIEPEFARYFKQKKRAYHSETIGRFSEAEAKAYLAELAERNKELKRALFPEWEPASSSDQDEEAIEASGLEMDEVTFQQIYRGADNGRPIYINLLADLLSFGETISDIFPPDEIPVDDVGAERIRRRIAHRLVNLPEPYRNIIRYLVYARQGLDVSLLLHLVDHTWGKVEATGYLQDMRRYTFIKTHPQHPNRLFLHDEVADLLDQYYLDDRAETEPTFERIRDYHGEQHKNIADELEQMRGRAGSKDRLEREQLMRQLEDVRAPLLYYQMQIDPLLGFFQHYLRWAEVAIKGNQTGYDMRLRDAVLGFLNYLETAVTPRKQWLADRIDQPAFDRIFALLWVRRYLARGQFRKAYRVANNLLNSDASPFKWDNLNDDLYQGLLLTLLGEARLYFTPEDGKNTPLTVLPQAIEILDPRPEKFEDERDEEWRWARTLGRTHNDIGYAYRSRDQFSSAIEPYRKAIILYREIDIRDEMADTINNLAFVYARLGAIDEAIMLAEDARALREDLQQQYQLGYSSSTLGLVHLEAFHPHQALALYTQALNLFTVPGSGGEREVGNERGRAMAQYGRGKAYRGLGNFVHSGVYSREEAAEHFENGRNALDNALELSGERKGLYQLEMQAELGRLYRDWMRMFLLFEDRANARERQKLALLHLRDEALKIAKELKLQDQEANILHDLAQLYWEWGDEKKTQDYLERAASRIPKEYIPQTGTGFAGVKEPVNPFWVILGKIYLLEAELIFKPESVAGPMSAEQIAALLEGLEKRLLAVACFEQYSAYYSNPLMRATRKAMYDSLKRYGIPQLERIREKTGEVAEKYRIDLHSIEGYMQRTIGIFATGTQ